jgi:hypothetical protein
MILWGLRCIEVDLIPCRSNSPEYTVIYANPPEQGINRTRPNMRPQTPPHTLHGGLPCDFVEKVQEAMDLRLHEHAPHREWGCCQNRAMSHMSVPDGFGARQPWWLWRRRRTRSRSPSRGSRTPPRWGHRSCVLCAVCIFSRAGVVPTHSVCSAPSFSMFRPGQ